MSTPPHSSEVSGQSLNPSIAATAAATCSNSPRTPSSRVKLRKIPPIPVRRSPSKGEFADGSDEDGGDSEGEEASIILASSLGLNHIRTRSAPLPSPLLFSSLVGSPSIIGNHDELGKDGVWPRDKCSTPNHNSTEQGNFSLPGFSLLPLLRLHLWYIHVGMDWGKYVYICIRFQIRCMYVYVYMQGQGQDRDGLKILTLER